MRALIVDHEKKAAGKLANLLGDYDPSVEIVAMLDSLHDLGHFLKNHPHPDILFLETELSDGSAPSMLKKLSYNKPVIFVTDHEQHALDAFRLCCIDYIIKPLSQESLARALQKLVSLTDINGAGPAIQSHNGNGKNNHKKRFLGKVGQRWFFIEAGDIAFFEADNKIVHLVDKEGSRYLVDFTLEQLESVLDPLCFFRLNRKYIVNVHAIEQVRPYHNSRLRLSVKGATANEEMVISRERVSDFKIWAEN